MDLSAYKLPDDDLRRSSYSRAISSAARLFAFSNTKWPELLLPDALRQIDDELLSCALNLRRVLEREPKPFQQVKAHWSSLTGTPKEKYDHDLWRIMGRIVHHIVMKPIILSDPKFFAGATGYLVCDLEVESDNGVSLISIAGFAIAAANELGKSLKKSSKSEPK